MNRVILIGRLVAAPELRYTQQNKPVTSYRLAVDRLGDGADFFTCVAWNKAAEFAAEHLSKGTKIAIEGRLQTRSYDDKDGKKVTVTEIVVDRHEFCESKKAEGSNSVSHDNLDDIKPIGGVVNIVDDDDIPW